MSRTVDVVVIGSGLNGLVAATYLARAGMDVEVLERSDAPGGCLATDELTVPGFQHDALAGFHPLFALSRAHRELGDELAGHGLAFAPSGDVVTGTVGAGRAVLGFRDPEHTAAQWSAHDARAYLDELEGAARLAPLLEVALDEELRSWRTVARLLGRTRSVGRAGRRQLLASGASSVRAWLQRSFDDDGPGALLAPWALHMGLAPDDAGGQIQLLALTGSLHAAGLPVARGGSAMLARALVATIEAHGGKVRTGVDVEQITVRTGHATGVVAGGEAIGARRAVVANTTPWQLYERLLPAGTLHPDMLARVARFRPGRRAGMQIHLALSGSPRWRADPRLGTAGLVHVSEGPGDIAIACAQAAAGLLPVRPTIACGQPTALDPTRAPDGRAILWLQLLEVPTTPIGDAADEIDVDPDGGWTTEIEEAFADRVVERLAQHIDGLRDTILGRCVLSPAALERRNINLVGGDIYAGATSLDQSLIWRPPPVAGSHATPVGRLFICGASTHPGPGLTPASGRIVARRILDGRRYRDR